MALKFNITADEHAELDEGLRSAYVQDGDAFRLDIDGDPPGISEAKARVDEFRTNNIRLSRENEELKTRNSTLQESLQTAEADQAKAAESGETLAQRLGSVEKKLEAAEKARAAAERRAHSVEYDRIIRESALGAGVSPAAIDDAVSHLQHRRGMILDRENGVITSQDGSTTLEDALGNMRKENPYFFSSSNGAGLNPGRGTRTPPPEPKKVTSILDNIEDIIEGKAKWEPPE